MASVAVRGSDSRVISAALPGVVKGVGAQVYNSNVVLNRIRKGGNTRPWRGESEQIAVFDQEYDKSQAYQDDDAVLSTDAVKIVTAGQFELGGYQSTVNLPGMELRKVKSTAGKVYDLLKVHTQAAFMGMRDTMADDLFATGNSAKGLLSLSTMTDASTTIAGISGGTGWGGTTVASGSMLTQGKKDLYTTYSTLSSYGSLENEAGTDSPDISVTAKANKDYYWLALQAGMRYSAGGKGDVAMDLMFMGKPIIADEHCASGVWYLLNTKKMFLYVMPDANFKVLEPTRSEQQPDMYNIGIIWNGQLVFNTRRYSGKCTGMSA